MMIFHKAQQFQSTPPARGATIGHQYCYKGDTFQSTPPARGATKVFKNSGSMLLLFQSTPPARGGDDGPGPVGPV